MDDSDPTVDAVVDYCRTQARLLSGQAETLTAEIDGLLDEIDAEATAVRERLDGQREHADSPAQPSHPGSGTVGEDTVAELEAKQERVAEKQATLDEIGDISAEYADLAATIQAETSDTTGAIERVLAFEAEVDAPTFFEDRETLLETATDQ